ncbi:MAG: response regulator [Motiliproteus sp.]
MNTAIHVLVVDDHRDIRDLLSKYLRQHGLRVSTAAGGQEMKQLLRTAAVDLVVLDIMMPGEDGLSLCRHLRASCQTPVILLTAVTEETDRIIGLEMGADDYLTKPFSPRELLARIKAILRRAQSLPAQRQPSSAEKIGFAHWVLDLARRELSSTDGVGVALSSSEFLLLTTFINHPQMVLSRDQLLDLTRGREAVALDRSIDNQVSRLRRKIEPDPANPTLIKTVWGGGYIFASDVTRT